MGEGMKHPEHLGGGGAHIQAQPTAYIDPETERDMAMLSQAIGVVQRRINGLRHAGAEVNSGLYDWLRMMKSFQKDMAINGSRRAVRLSARVRHSVMRTLGLNELPPLKDNTPEVLKNLPLKPPGRA